MPADPARPAAPDSAPSVPAGAEAVPEPAAPGITAGAGPGGPSLDSAAELGAALLDWFDRHRRAMPWRAAAGSRPDPYRVWLAEIMLQQTTVATVDAYYRGFLARWPTVEALAAAELDQVLAAWAGLGYYARARNLHRCARLLVERHGGRFPDSEAELRRLPGIGEYTAAAIAAIAFDRPAAVLDGNVERVLARLFAVEEPLPAAKPRLKALAERLTPARRPGDHAQAAMDLGATVCTPRQPKCILCPWRAPCAGRRAGIAAELPRKAPRPERPTRRAIAFWALDRTDAVLLRRRPDKGLLGGMMEVPSSPWLEAAEVPRLAEVGSAAPARARWTLLPGRVTHTFSHFHLELAVAAARVDLRPAAAGGIWVPLDALGEQALPTAMRKIVRHALKHHR